METSGPEPHLVLYIDVNKTMIMIDAAQDKSIENVINDILTENAYGFCDEETHSWTWNQQELGKPPTDLKMISYGNFLRSCYQKGGSVEKMKEGKQIRKMLRATFTAPGSPGEGLANEALRIREALSLPQEVIGTEESHAAGLHNEFVFILPSFYKMLLHLHSSGRHFNIVLRTFGEDLDLVVKEFNAFCEGRHPIYPGSRMDGSDGGLDRRIDLESFSGHGTFHRTEDDIMLIMGTLHQPENHQARKETYEQDQSLHCVSGVQDIHAHLVSLRSTRPSLALRDDYHFWWQNQEAAHAGKVMTVAREDPMVHEIFLDDNILHQDAHIVDARDAATGDSLPFHETQHIHVVRVESLQAILDPDYFIKLIQQAEAQRQALPHPFQ